MVLVAAARVDSDDHLAPVKSVEKAGEPGAAGLWVMLDAGGEVYRVAVKRGEAADYVREYVAGRAPVAIPDRFLTEWLKSKAAGARIMRAEQCTAGGSCVRLRGLYAGRSPNNI